MILGWLNRWWACRYGLLLPLALFGFAGIICLYLFDAWKNAAFVRSLVFGSFILTIPFWLRTTLGNKSQF